MNIASEMGHLAVSINILWLRENPVGPSEFRTRDLAAPSPMLCLCATQVRLVIQKIVQNTI